MSKFIENHPSTIEVFIFYGRKIGTSGLYEKLCKVIGENGISEEEFKKLFDKMMTKDEEAKKKEIRQLVKNNQANLRICILSDVIDKKSTIESFLSITKMIGTRDIDEMIESKNIDYHDFEFWFNRFSSGNWNLDQKTFYDLPIEVVGNIAEKSDFPSQMQLRKVSHGLRNIVDQMRPLINELRCEFINKDSENTAIVAYTEETRYETCFTHTCSYTGEDFVERALNDMKILLNNPRLRLEFFKWANYLSEEYNDEFVDILNSLNHQIEIVSLDVSSDGDLMIYLLEAIKPETLVKICINEEFGPSEFQKLAQLDQWQKAECVCISSLIYNYSYCSQHFQHFKEVDLTVQSLSMYDILRIRQAFIENDKLEAYEIQTHFKPSKRKIVIELDLYDDIDMFISCSGRYDIPDTNDYLEVCITEDGITFHRESADSD